MQFLARIRPLLSLLLCFGSLLLSAPASAAPAPCAVQQDESNSPASESQSGAAPCISDDGAEGAFEVDARRRLCELHVGPDCVTLGKAFEQQSLRLRKEDRRRCRPPN